MGRFAEAQRKLLEQMMGAEAMGIVTVQLHFTDEKVCKNYLCGTCPHIVFTNTKMDLGPCPKAHQEKLQIEYNMAKLERPDDPVVNRIEQEWISNIYSFVDECDRRINASQRRLEKTPEENAKTTALMREIGEIELSIQDGTAEIEALGEAGKISESLEKDKAVDALKAEKAEKERELQQLADTSGASGHQKLRVCEICGAYLSILDSDRRLADHFGGKMHLGYKELRELLVKIREDRAKPRAAPAVVAAPPPVAGAIDGPAPLSSGGPPPPGGYSNGGPPPPPPSSSLRAPEDRDRYERHSSHHSSSRDDDRRRERERDPRDTAGSSHRRAYDDDRRDSSRRYDDYDYDDRRGGSGSRRDDDRRDRSRSPRRR